MLQYLMKNNKIVRPNIFTKSNLDFYTVRKLWFRKHFYIPLILHLSYNILHLQVV